MTKNPKSESRNPKQSQNPKYKGSKQIAIGFRIFVIRISDLFRISRFGFRI